MGGPRIKVLSLFAALAVVVAGVAPLTDGGVAAAAAPAPKIVSYSATVTIPVPPASNYAGGGGGDGWAVALTPTAVYNVFHHAGVLQVSCHLQSNASACWSPVAKTVVDGSARNFATSGQPGLWMDQGTGHLYVFATRSDGTGGVVCVDTTKAPSATGAQLFCGFTALTGVGESYGAGISGISNLQSVGTKMYAYNFRSGFNSGGSAGTTAENTLLCFDQVTLKACTSQPFKLNIGSATVSIGSFPASNAIAAIGNQIIVPIVDGAQPELACFNTSTKGACAGTWPVQLGFSYPGQNGAPVPMLSAAGALIGVCLPTGTDQCFTLAGHAATTPSHMTGVIHGNDPWNGPAIALGPRIYVPNGNTNANECFDFSINATCAHFPKVFTTASYTYTVNADPARPECIWINSDGGSAQIQNYDAYTGGACGTGDIRVLASSVVANIPKCTPGAWNSLQVLAPPRGSYSSGTVAFQDSDANPIPGVPNRSLDGTGTADLTGLNLNAAGLPQFLITLHGASGNPGTVKVKLTWQGISDPDCVLAGTNVGGLGVNGIMMLGSDGGMFGFGELGFIGAPGVGGGGAPFSALAAKKGGAPGYWDVQRNGKVLPVGSATSHGDMSAVHLNAPIVGAAAPPDGNGYWLVGADGGVFGFGSAHFYGSMGGMHLNAPIVAIVSAADGHGYWLIAADGGVFGYGSAHFYGSMGGAHLVSPIVGAARTLDGAGYYLVAADGGVFGFGNAHFHGSQAGAALNAPIVAIAVDQTGNGYWLVGADGGVFAKGDAPFQGALPSSGVHLQGPIVAAVN